jgi:hypothetical protein
MKVNQLTLTALVFVLLAGCQDNTAPLQPRVAMTDDASVSAPQSDQGLVEVDMLVSSPKPPPVIAALRLQVSPWRSQFKRGDTPDVKVFVQREAGDEVEVTTQALIGVEPENGVTLTSEFTLSFLKSGTAVVTACYSNLCDQVNLIVNDGPPTLVVTAPIFGAALTGPQSQGITVTGNANDDGPSFVVKVNDTIVEVDEAGNFTTSVPAVFGMNSITVTADDGLSVDRAVVIRDVLWSEVYAPSEPTGISIARPAAIRVDQRLFDANEPFEIPGTEGRVSVEGVSEFIELLLTVIDVNQLIDPASLFGENGPDIEIAGFSLGAASVDFEITSTGLDLFLTLPDGRIDTAGALDLQGQPLSLDGSLGLVLSARVGLDVAFDGGLTSDIAGVDVALEALVPSYQSQAVEAILELAKPEIRALIEAEFGVVLGDLLGQLVSSFVEEGIGNLFNNLQGIEVNLDTGIGPSSELGLTISLAPSELTLASGRMMVMDMDFVIEHEPIDTEPHIIPGCPVFSGESWTEIPSRGVGLSMRPAILNCVLFSAWRQGLLRFPVPIPAELAAIVSEVNIDAYLPPLFRPSSSPNGYPFEMQFGSLLIDVKRMGSDATDTYSISLRAGMDVDLQGGSLAVILADLPTVRATLESAGSTSPLPTAILEQTMVSLVWEEMKNSLLGGLDLSLAEIPVELGTITDLAPRVNQLTVQPTFDQRVLFLEDRLSFEGFLRLSVDLASDDG